MRRCRTRRRTPTGTGRGAKKAKGSTGNSKGSKDGGSGKDSAQHPRKEHKCRFTTTRERLEICYT